MSHVLVNSSITLFGSTYSLSIEGENNLSENQARKIGAEFAYFMQRAGDIILGEDMEVE